VPSVVATNGRIKPDVVLVNGREERHAEGTYYLEKCCMARSYANVGVSAVVND
jgi:hypothetical protein